MSDRTEEEYKQAQKVIKILIKKGIVSGESGIEEYTNLWDAVFEIIKEVKSNE